MVTASIFHFASASKGVSPSSVSNGVKKKTRLLLPGRSPSAIQTFSSATRGYFSGSSKNAGKYRLHKESVTANIWQFANAAASASFVRFNHLHNLSPETRRPDAISISIPAASWRRKSAIKSAVVVTVSPLSPVEIDFSSEDVPSPILLTIRFTIWTALIVHD